ncbi:MAG TPA: helicase HerA-like domain-containing protein [Kofleriaceae bacterium]|nr:helicase HerA-like domain-containing protein [Kofleriaceae bacterium]
MSERVRLDNTRLHADITHIHALLSRLASGARGAELARRAREAADGKLTLPALVGLALHADCLRVIHAAASADGRITDQEIEALHEFLYSTARQYASVRRDYAGLHPLDDERAREFLEAYAVDTGAFGNRHRATTWLGLDLCRRAAALGEPDAYDRYERMILRLCDESIRIGGVDLGDPRGKARLAEIHGLRAQLAADGRGASTTTEVDRRMEAFLTGRRVFTSTEQAASVFEEDPFDVVSVHESARLAFERLLDQATTPAEHLDRGRMLLILGDSGAGKTHLLRAFRGHVHDRASGFCAYAQLQSRAIDYARYLLAHVVDSLEHPYAVGSQESGLVELSSGPGRLLGDSFLTAIERLRDGTWPDPESLADHVNSLVDVLLDQPDLSRFDPDLLRALLYVQRREPKVTARVVKWLRCEDMNAYDRRWLGGIIPRTGPDDAIKMIEQLARLAFVTQGAAFVLMVDQAELAGFHEEASASFRRAIATLHGVTTTVPSAVAVIACLDNLYDTTRPMLTRSAVDRLESDPPVQRLTSNRTYPEIEAIVSRRLEWLYAGAGATFRPAQPTHPFSPDSLQAFANRRTRDVLDHCHRAQEASSAAGHFVDKVDEERPFGPAGGHDPAEAIEAIDAIASGWNDAVHAPGLDIPDEEPAVLELLARAARACREEIDGLEIRVKSARDRLEIDVTLGQRQAALLVAVANSGYQGGAFSRQVKSLRQDAGSARSPVIVRTFDFPRGARTDDLLAEHLRQGGRKVLAPETALRALMVLGDFASSHPPELVARWRRRDQPIASLPAVRELFDLDALLPSGFPFDGPISKDTERDIVPLPPIVPPAEPAAELVAAPPPTGQDILLGEAAAFEGGPSTTPVAKLARHVAILGTSGSGKTTLALNLIEQLVERGASAVLVDRKGDLAGYARPDWWRSIDDPVRRRRAAALAGSIDVRLFTPGNAGGRPLSFGVVPHLDGVPVHDRVRLIQYATSALASMMRLRAGANDNALRAILLQAITVLAERRAPASLDQLVTMVAERDDQLVSRAARYNDRLFERLVQGLETLRLGEAELFDPGAEALSGELLLGRAAGGKIPFSVVSTRFLGDTDRVQAWVAQLLVELYRWCGKAPSDELQSVLLLDEADLYAPAGMVNPPSKGPLQDLIKRSRSAGLGLLLASQSPADFDYRLRDLITTWIVGKIGDKRSVEKMRPLFERRPQVASKLTQLSEGNFVVLQEAIVQEIRREPSLLRTDQLPDTEILALARAQRPK